MVDLGVDGDPGTHSVTPIRSAQRTAHGALRIVALRDSRRPGLTAASGQTRWPPARRVHRACHRALPARPRLAWRLGELLRPPGAALRVVPGTGGQDPRRDRRAGQAEDLLGDLMYRVMRRLHRPIDAVATVVHPRDRLARVRRREKIDEALFFHRPDWGMTDVDTPSGYAFDVHRCLYADYLRGRGEQGFCQRVLCAQDHRMAEGRGEVLVRTGTLASGAGRCDFHYMPGSGRPVSRRAHRPRTYPPPVADRQPGRFSRSCR